MSSNISVWVGEATDSIPVGALESVLGDVIINSMYLCWLSISEEDIYNICWLSHGSFEGTSELHLVLSLGGTEVC